MGEPQVDGSEQPERDQSERDQAAIQAELRDVEEELESLRAQAWSLRGPLGGRDAGPMDLAENAAQVTLAEEQEALIEVLEARRDTLLRRLESLR